MKAIGSAGVRGLCAAAVLSALAGCNHLVTSGEDTGAIARGAGQAGNAYALPSKPLIPNATVKLTPSYSITLEKLLYAGAVYYFVDPLSPNWQGEMRRLSEDTFSIALRSKRFRSVGGDGEAGRVFRRNADEIVRSGGFTGYTVLSYSEGIESETLGAVRVADGVVQVSRR